ncbi:hypothetical protein UFOVP650_82 [uncultured Caudovirales phage]|uniref:Uncharacterized protein n=1 Tax=uncultured Caudovirales phage TaxID=2100421 RepID=A0A6J5NIA6_9CAUD|nr:hypothetical protein UFOVP650_82 [uncultured Caudovirales phage]
MGVALRGDRKAEVMGDAAETYDDADVITQPMPGSLVDELRVESARLCLLPKDSQWAGFTAEMEQILSEVLASEKEEEEER